MVFPILMHMADSEDESIESKKMKFALLKNTNMADFVGNLYAEIHGLDEPPAEYTKKREEVLAQREKYEEATSALMDLLDDEAVVGNLRSDKTANLNYLKENHGVTPEMVQALFDYGQFKYNCGLYDEAPDMLYRFRVLVGPYLISPF